MSLTAADLDFLTSEAGRALLARLADEDLGPEQTLLLLSALRRDHSPEQAAAALTLARLRARARGKFGPDAERMFFTADALEQASDPTVRSYRAAYFRGLRVLDVCCGIGADALALAEAGAQVLGLDIDPLRVLIAQHNAAALGLDVHFRVADVREGLPDGYDAVFYDPARRDEKGRRLHHVELYRPPLSLVKGWGSLPAAVKLSPGVDLQQLDEYGGSVEFISVGGELKEAVLWLNRDRAGLQATLLSGGQVFHWRRESIPDAAVAPPRGWLVEPDPSLLRAGLVQDAAAAFGGSLLDETIAYFTTDLRPQSPWLRSWQVLDWMPFNLKKLRACLVAQGVGRVTVKKRGSPLEPEELIARLKLKKGPHSRTLVLTRHAGRPVVLICADMA